MTKHRKQATVIKGQQKYKHKTQTHKDSGYKNMP